MIRRAFYTVVLLLSGLVDIPAHSKVAGISGLGVLTILVGVAIAGQILAHPQALRRHVLRIWPFAALFMYALLQHLWHPFSVQGAQNLFLLWVFIGLILLLSAGPSARHEEEYLERMLLRGTGIAAFLYGISLLLDGPGTESLIGARSFALFTLPGLSMLLSRWAHGSRKSFWLAVGLTGLIAFSLSRTALAVAIFLFPLAKFRSLTRRDLLRGIRHAAVSLVVFFLLVTSTNQLSTRFLRDDSIGAYFSRDATLDTSGRLTFWALTMDSVNDSPWIGKGPGSASDLIESIIGDISHPHNEYLRILHDSGIVGLTFLLLGCIRLLLQCRSAYRRAMVFRSPSANVHLGAFLALAAVLLTMITDNTASYVYVMAPLGILVGMTFRASLRFSRAEANLRSLKAQAGKSFSVANLEQA